jgi:hypothetical protein
MDINQICGTEWGYVLGFLPEDIEQSCREKLALVRGREIQRGSDLLRLCLAYSVCDMSLRQAAAWASTIGLGQLSNVAVLKRLRQASDWLGYVVTQWLVARGLTTQVPPYQVRIVDATCISQPGSEGIDYRLHLNFDLQEMRIREVAVTDRTQGETLRRYEVKGGEVLLGDRGYAHRSGIVSVLEQGGHVVVRVNWKNVPLENAKGKPVEVISLLQTLDCQEVGDWPVWVRQGRKRYALRLIAIRKSAAATEKERRRIRVEARRKGWKLNAHTLRGAEYILLLTDLPCDALPALKALELYRFRWQIELVFKRLKSLLQLGQLRAKDPQLARTYLFSKILGALILEELTQTALSFFPWGFRLPRSAFEPLANDGLVG